MVRNYNYPTAVFFSFVYRFLQDFIKVDNDDDDDYYHYHYYDDPIENRHSILLLLLLLLSLQPVINVHSSLYADVNFLNYYYYYYYYYYYFLFCTLANLIPIYLPRERVITHDQRILRFHLLTLLSSSLLFISALKLVVPLKTIPDFRP